MRIVKAEILWSRKCYLNCSYCAMADGRVNSLLLKDWIKGFDNLKELGCGFAAFYGAEPLNDFNRLPEIVGYAESIGIATTVITSGSVKNFRRKLDLLHQAGARSLSMSYDIVPLDKSSKNKSEKAIDNLLYFQKKKNIRDVAAITTLTRLNFSEFLHSVVELSKKNIWSFFDIVHDDRGQPGSKCRHYPGIKKLMFKEEDNNKFIDFLKSLKALKEAGNLCHSSHNFMDTIVENPCLLQDYSWNCAKSPLFPSWVTVDCDGVVYPCDDFQPYNPVPIFIHQLSERWEEFCKIWQPIVSRDCPGCLWNTHLDAHFIKDNKLPFSDYIHDKNLSSA